MKTRILTFGELEIRFNWLIVLCILAGFSGLVRLGIWQLHRAQEKIQLQKSYDEMGANTAVPVENVQMSGLENDAITLQNLHVSLKGEYQNGKTIFLIYQTYEDELGYAIVTPFKLDSSDKVVMVNRGWAYANSYEEIKNKIKPVPGKLTLTGQIYVPTEKMANKTNDIDLKTVKWPLLIRFLNTLELDPLFDESIFPYEVRLDEDQPGVLIRHWPTVMVNTGRHYSYALQWFAMSIALLIASFVLSSNILAVLKKRSSPH